MNFLITGAQMNNKGAQSMLFVTVDELTKRFPGSQFYFLSFYEYDNTKFTFHEVPCRRETQKIAIATRGRRIELYIFAFLRNCLKFVLEKHDPIFHFYDLYNIRKTIDVIIDISGFAIGDKWSINSHEMFLDNIRFAEKYNIPIYLMPQSFGPFHYSTDKEFLKSELQKYFQIPRLIFAREKQGVESLADIGIDNVILNCDIVLQNKGVNRENIYKQAEPVEIEKIDNPAVVGLVPNKQCMIHGNPETVIKLYVDVIKKLLSFGNDVYVFAHSKDDTEICRELKAQFKEDDRVKLREQEMSCFMYDEYVKQFKYIICSRYHGIVHAYRNAIPAILLGWADKYKELAETVNQSEYYFNILHSNSHDDIMRSIERMNESYLEERAKIQEALTKVQDNNCFDIVSQDINAYFYGGNGNT